jgi:hypothetical protein
MTTQTVTTKICSKCGEEKSFSEFSPHFRGKFGLQSRCKKCKNLLLCEYRMTPDAKELRKEYKKTENVRIYNKQYNKTEKVKKYAKEYKKQYCKRAYHSDKKYKIKVTVRNSLTKIYLRYSTKGKQVSSSSIFTNEAMEHLLKTAPTESSYHIDHIIPISVFNVDNIEHLKLAHLPQNLRWLPAIENMSKNDSIDWSLIDSNEVLSNIAKEIGLVKE